MEDLKGTKVEVEILPRLKKVAELIYFDGPLLSLFTNTAGDTYLYNWSDNDEEVNRWLVFRVNTKSLTSYLKHHINLRDLILNPSDDFVYAVDLDDDLRRRALYIIKPDDLPSSYVPKAESFYTFEPVILVEDAVTSILLSNEPEKLLTLRENALIPRIKEDTRDRGNYRIQLDGNWTLEELSEFPHNYSQVYAFKYYLQLLKQFGRAVIDRTYRSYPWRGGYSAVNFYRRLKSVIPSVEQPQITSIYYASPGWIELSLNAEVAHSIKDTITSFEKYSVEIEYLYDNTHRELSRRRLLTSDSKLDELDGREIEQIVSAKNELATMLKVEDLGIIERAGEDPLVTLKILLSFYRRLRVLAAYELENKAHF